MIPFARLRRIALPDAQKWAGSLAAACAFCTAAASGELALPIVLAFPLFLAGALVFGDRLAGKYHRAWTGFLLLALSAEVTLVALGQEDAVLATVQFAVLLCMHRLWHRRTERDEYLLLLLSLVIMCAGAALSAELLFGLGFIAYAVCGTWAFALTHLRFEVERRTDEAQPSARRIVITPSLFGRLAALAVAGLLGTVLIFIGFPRMPIGGWRRHPAGPRNVAGLSDQITLSGRGTIADDPRVALRVRTGDANDSGGELPAMHWRARSFDVWTGNGWRARNDLGRKRLLSESPAMRRAASWRAHRASLETVEVEAVAGFSDGIVMTPEGWPISAYFPRGVAGRTPRVFRATNGDLFYTPLEANDARYLVTVDRSMPAREELRGRGKEYPPEVAIDLAAPPDLDPRVAALSRRLTAGKDPADAATAVETWLSNALSYSRDLTSDRGDPIANFLFHTKQGHCELFSSAMVILLRAAGIPARNVTGYYGGTPTDDGYVAIRAGDAHSWVEVYFPGAGFVPFDPTPAADRGAGATGIWASAVLFWDSMAQRWSRTIVDYDLVAQSRVARSVGRAISGVGARLRGKGTATFSVEKAWPVGVAAAILAAGAILAVRRRRREGPRGRMLSGDEARARDLWLATQKRLERARVLVGPSTGIREAVEKVVSLFPRAQDSLTGIAEAVLAARWGGQPLERQEARRLLAQLDVALR